MKIAYRRADLAEPVTTFSYNSVQDGWHRYIDEKDEAADGQNAESIQSTGHAGQTELHPGS